MPESVLQLRPQFKVLHSTVLIQSMVNSLKITEEKTQRMQLFPEEEEEEDQTRMVGNQWLQKSAVPESINSHFKCEISIGTFIKKTASKLL